MSAFAPPLSLARAPPRRAVARRPRSLPRYTPAPPCPRRAAPPSAVHTPPPLPPAPSGRTADYHANVGSVIDHLRHFYPRLLLHEPDLLHYAPHLLFADSTGYCVQGHDAYRAAFWMLRAQARVFFSSAAVSITSLYYDDAMGMIYLRWRVSASPRAWVLMGSGRRGPVVLDGLSVYTLDRTGLVAVHQLESNSRRRSGLRHMFEDILAVGTVRVPGTPAGAGVGSGGSGLPPWFRSVFEPLEFVAVSEEEMECEEHLLPLEDELFIK